MIIWTGWGILTPFLIGTGIFGAIAGANLAFGKGFSGSHPWVVGAGLALGGFLCWLVGHRLYSGGTQVLVDRTTGRDVILRPSHTLFFIPMHWLGILAMLLGGIGILVLRKPAPGSNAQISSSGQRTERPGWWRSSTEPSQFSSAAEAQQAATQKYPELGRAGSPFNKAFLDLHRKSLQQRPELFRDTNWPLTLADEVAQTLK